MEREELALLIYVFSHKTLSLDVCSNVENLFEHVVSMLAVESDGRAHPHKLHQLPTTILLAAHHTYTSTQTQPTRRKVDKWTSVHMCATRCAQGTVSKLSIILNENV